MCKCVLVTKQLDNKLGDAELAHQQQQMASDGQTSVSWPHTAGMAARRPPQVPESN